MAQYRSSMTGACFVCLTPKLSWTCVRCYSLPSQQTIALCSRPEQRTLIFHERYRRPLQTYCGFTNRHLSVIPQRSAAYVCRNNSHAAPSIRCTLRVGSAPVLPVAAALACFSAVLGPLLDGYHGAFGVLTYTHPWNPIPSLHTAWFVPPLFAFAGVCMGIGALYVDQKYPALIPRPKFSRTFAVIAAFSALYYTSGALFACGLEAVSGPVLAVLSFIEWYALDKSVGAAALGIASALAGFVVEAYLVNFAGLYTYASSDVLGLPLWIVPCYFAGGPAVASLARSFAAVFERKNGGEE